MKPIRSHELNPHYDHNGSKLGDNGSAGQTMTQSTTRLVVVYVNIAETLAVYHFDVPREEEATVDIKILMERLSVALLNVILKEDIAKQHAKVAEEGVTGSRT